MDNQSIYLSVPSFPPLSLALEGYIMIQMPMVTNTQRIAACEEL
jgi:hypothetical protein